MKNLLLAMALFAQERPGEEAVQKFKEAATKIQSAYNERKAESIRALFDDRMMLELPLPKLQLLRRPFGQIRDIGFVGIPPCNRIFDLEGVVLGPDLVGEALQETEGSLSRRWPVIGRHAEGS